jgi:iron complex outermembrane receptor protein
MRLKLFAMGGFICLSWHYADSQESGNDSLKTDTTKKAVSLNEVVISENRTLPPSVFKEPKSIGYISRRDMERNTGLSLQDAINLVPSVQMQTRSMFGGQRIVIRGYGTDVFSSNFNGTGYKVYMNGIPITDAQGLTIMDAIDNTILGRVEVTKGPSSSLYGTGIGGAVNMYTIKPEANTTKIMQEGMAGSYGLWRTNTRIETATDKSAIMVNYGHQNYDSYRIDSKSKKDFATITGDFKNNDKHSTSIYVNYTNSYEQLAGEMDSTHFYSKQNWADTAYTNNKARVEMENFRGGVSHKTQFCKDLSNTTSTYFNGYTLHQAAGNKSFTSNAVQNFGGRTQFNYSHAWNKVNLEGILGGEFQKTISYNKTYNSVDAKLGTIKGDLEITGMQYNSFTQWRLTLPYAISLTAGASMNFLEYNITDFYNLAAHKSQSGYKRFDPVLTPRMAVQKIFNDHITAYADVSQGYSPPTTSQMVIPYLGTVNTGLKPEFATQYEVGSKGSLLRNKLSYQVAVFDLRITNKIVSQAIPNTPSGNTESVNVGGQENKGAELFLGYSVANDPTKFLSYLRPFASYTYLNCVYSGYKSDNNNTSTTIDYSGKNAVGVSPNVYNVGLDVALKFGLYLNVTYQSVDREPLNFINSRYAPAYSLLNGKIGYKQMFGKHFSCNVYAGGNNLTNQLYYTMVFVNANPASNPASFMPGPYMATFYGGASLSYKF